MRRRALESRSVRFPGLGELQEGIHGGFGALFIGCGKAVNRGRSTGGTQKNLFENCIWRYRAGVNLGDFAEPILGY